MLAAAVRANAEIIVTANIADFPRSACAPYDIDTKHPDDFLLDQLDLYPDRTVRCVRELVDDLRRPPTSMPEFLERFRRTVPRFADEVSSWF
ncbi:hypothetical protein Actkin_06415 [Actinokineospora sp. UTMC 2448]|nr:hypothetical protein Actkin_06415 [Actinokineospora sp. UTMC 2448]